MEKIILVCNGGMSTSIMAKQIRDASNDTYDVQAYSESVYADHLDGVKVVLVAPQIRFLVPNIQKLVGDSCFVQSIDPRTYGMMDGKTVLKIIQKIYEDNNLES